MRVCESYTIHACNRWACPTTLKTKANYANISSIFCKIVLFLAAAGYKLFGRQIYGLKSTNYKIFMHKVSSKIKNILSIKPQRFQTDDKYELKQEKLLKLSLDSNLFFDLVWLQHKGG